MKRKRILCICLASFMLFVCGCNKKQATHSVSNLKKGEISYPIDTTEKLTYWRILPSNISADVSNLGETEFAKNLKEATGIEVEYIHPAQGQENAINLLLASDDLPDIIQTDWIMQSPTSCIEQQLILKLNDYVKDYAPNFANFLKENQDLAKQVVDDEGNYYSFPFIRNDKTLYSSRGIIVRSDLFDELGLQIPETIEEWDRALEAVKKKCKTPFATNTAGYIAFMGGFDAFNSLYLKDNKVHFGAIEENYKKYIAKLHEWYEKGYIDKNYAIADQKMMDSAMLNGESAITVGSGGSTMGSYLSAKPTDKYSLSAAKFPSVKKGVNSKFSVSSTRYSNTGAAVSTNCKHPELAVRFLDFGYSEKGALFYNFGKEGESYNMINDYPTYKPELLSPKNGKSAAQMLTLNCLGPVDGPFLQDKRYLEQYYTNDSQKKAVERWAETDWQDYRLPALTLTAEETEEYNSIMSEINIYLDEMLNNMIIGKVSVDKFNDYVKTAKTMGIERAIKIQQDAYDRYLKR